jgi:hypothetical protein
VQLLPQRLFSQVRIRPLILDSQQYLMIWTIGSSGWTGPKRKTIVETAIIEAHGGYDPVRASQIAFLLYDSPKNRDC